MFALNPSTLVDSLQPSKLHFSLLITEMTATLNMPKVVALSMLAKAQDGNELMQILDAVVDTQEDQVPVPSDAYIMENDYDDSMDV
jgi:hypothetical protein